MPHHYYICTQVFVSAEERDQSRVSERERERDAKGLTPECMHAQSAACVRASLCGFLETCRERKGMEWLLSFLCVDRENGRDAHTIEGTPDWEKDHASYIHISALTIDAI
mmetsp:Transcript_14175/g.28423  ORF Transcript_14175/g.28423 Transcript_14175/m.28423 type:complete len:110 (+) Transcript_14175:722-1051(+)